MSIQSAGSISPAKRRNSPLTLTLPLLLAAPLLAYGSSIDGAEPGGGKKNIVYVQTNDYTPNQNSIIAYGANNGNACLQEIGRYSTGGTGLFNFDDRIGPDDHAQEVVIDRANRRLLTVNGGSDSIAVFDIKPNGGLAPVSGSPFASNGMQPVSIGLAANGVVYAVNQAGDPTRLPTTALPNYTGFRTQADGSLAPIPGSTFNLPPLSYPTQALTRPDGDVLFGDPFLGRPYAPQLFPFLPAAGSFLDAFKILPSGLLHEAPGSPVTPDAGAQAAPGIPNSRYVLGMWLHPTENIVYVTYVVTNKLAVYTYDRNTGAMTFVRDVAVGGPGFPDAISVCWVVVSPDGRYLYTSDAGSNAISVFDVSGSKATSPVLVQVFPLKTPAGAGGTIPPAPIPGVFNSPTVPFQIDTDPEGNFLYAVAHELVLNNSYPQGNVVHSLKIDKRTGFLSEPSCSPVQINGIPAGAHPQGVAAL